MFGPTEVKYETLQTNWGAVNTGVTLTASGLISPGSECTTEPLSRRLSSKKISAWLC